MYVRTCACVVVGVSSFPVTAAQITMDNENDLFSEGDDAGVDRDGDDSSVSPVTATKEQSEEPDTGSSTIFSPRSPLACLSMRRRVLARRRLSDSEGDSDNNHEDEPAQGRDLREIKMMLKQLCEKVDKNERVLADLQNKQSLRFVPQPYYITAHTIITPIYIQ